MNSVNANTVEPTNAFDDLFNGSLRASSDAVWMRWPEAVSTVLRIGLTRRLGTCGANTCG